MLIDYHRRLAADSVRNEAFRQALERTIRPGATRVADLGSGTGWLGFMSDVLGARSTTLYEREVSLAHLSASLARRNRLSGIEVFAEDSRAILDPEPVDLVVSETLGNLGLEEGIGEILWDARRFLAPGGIRIPSTLALYVRPVGGDRFWAELDPWSTGGSGLDLAPLSELSRQNLYVRSFIPADFAGIPSARIWDRVDFGTRYRTRRRCRVDWCFEQERWVFGFALWWVAGLIDGVALSTAPESHPTHWEQIFAPVLQPVRLAAGEGLGLEINARFSERTGVGFAWTVHAPRGIQSLSIRKGDLERPMPALARIGSHRATTKTHRRDFRS